MISIVIPTYNRAHLLGRAINSIISQKYMDWELIIINDGSTDDTDFVVHDFLIDSRVNYYKIDNSGAPFARNVGLKHAQGEWILFLDSDDLLNCNILVHLQEFINLNGKIDGIFGDTYFFKSVDARGSTYRPPNKIKYLDFVTGNPIKSLPSVVMKRNVVLEVGGFDNTLPARQDADLFFRILQNGDFLKIDKVISKVDNTASNRISDDRHKRFMGWFLFYSKHAFGLDYNKRWLLYLKVLKHALKIHSLSGIVKSTLLFLKLKV